MKPQWAVLIFTVLTTPAIAGSYPECHPEDPSRAWIILDSTASLPEGEVSDRVAGLDIHGTPRDLEIARAILPDRSDELSGKIRDKCPGKTTVVCALTAAFGSEKSAAYALASARKFGYVPVLRTPSHSPAIAWDSAELELLHSSLSKLPAHLLEKDLLPIRKIEDMSECGREMASGCFISGGLGPEQILIRNGRLNPGVILHEIAHRIDRLRGGRKSYVRLTERDPCYATQYAGIGGLGETFAEHMKELLLDPGNLASSCPSHYPFFTRFSRTVRAPLHWSHPLGVSLGAKRILQAVPRCLAQVSHLSSEYFHFRSSSGAQVRAFLSRGRIFDWVRSCAQSEVEIYAQEIAKASSLSCSSRVDESEFKDNLVSLLMMILVDARTSLDFQAGAATEISKCMREESSGARCEALRGMVIDATDGGA